MSPSQYPWRTVQRFPPPLRLTQSPSHLDRVIRTVYKNMLLFRPCNEIYFQSQLSRETTLAASCLTRIQPTSCVRISPPTPIKFRNVFRYVKVYINFRYVRALVLPHNHPPLLLHRTASPPFHPRRSLHIAKPSRPMHMPPPPLRPQLFCPSHFPLASNIHRFPALLPARGARPSCSLALSRRCPRHDIA